ncbi:MAG: TRAP transporter substrate-binding protein DctP [Rhodobiaceae bacterium]|nr:TRAP transporter substrate-binding protein DctP [Rhodobiaceae bacterium]MCC0056875.1 TRAP transporter substrate-binding protein DctP [Rhodobiaceae bacterium]
MMRILLALCALILGMTPISGWAADFTIRLSQFHSSESAQYKEVTLPLKEFIEKESGGRIAVETFPNGVLHGPADGFKALITDVTDITPAYPLFTRTSFHLSHGFFLPNAFQTAYANNQIAAELYDDYLRPEYGALGVEVFFHATSAPYALLTKTEVKSLEDLKGLKIRGAGGPVNKMVEALGAIPVTTASTEILTAFQQGVVDGVLVPAESWLTYNLDEVAKYIVLVDFGRAGDIPFAINPKLYEKLPPDLVDVMKRAGRYGSLLQADFVESNIARGMEAMKAKGAKVVELSAEDIAALDTAKAKLWTEFEQEHNKAGYPATEFIAKMKTLSSEFGAMTHDQMIARQNELNK